MVYCCQAHIDQGIDDFIDQHHESPELFNCCEVSVNCSRGQTVCIYCGKPAEYVLATFSEAKDLR